ncbi:thymidine kinase [Candidatus Roizmanbacteria bacterium CG_4_10_14_0_8_um_filter_33_9]|uniref:Thymidine kinase n=1 Tax=Candidatus Roizmanbacteria bacterium CG_4_10_14_0_8_um_filter_33_9 TaxID=1974826 RepID=A0A2M7QJQ5_9BACT|nr:MAG: thymidine kinase [Candidatus Roizmanbacteria bacterium CG_4_10_14_0_8_um_filter_33_9]
MQKKTQQPSFFLDIITGPMFSGKSEELVKRLQRYKIAGLHVMVFNHTLDKRYTVNTINSHSKMKWKAQGIKIPEDILKKIKKNTDVVIIDEAQFFGKSLITVIISLIHKHIHCIVAGLDTDFRGKPFGMMPQLLALADGEVVKLKAVCAVCKKWNATRSQRLLANGKPATSKDPLIKVGAKDSYEPRCLKHHIVL